jgi:[protein-PII] uridylyltransferase
MARVPRKVDLKLDAIIDGDDLRRELTAHTAETSGDGTVPEVRQAILAHLKAERARGEKLCEEWFSEDGSGTACAKRLAHLNDTIIAALYDFTVIHVQRMTNPTEGERMAIMAVGGYGRGALAPGSDLDLLFLLPYKQTAAGEAVVEAMLYMLWDMGAKVGHATRTMPECLRMAREDMTIRTALLEARHLHGNEALSMELTERFDREVVAGSANEFIEAKLAERDARHAKAGSSRYRVEPNIKEGKGGQRDLHTLFWIAKYFYRVQAQDALVEAGVLSRQELKTFVGAQDFLWAVRCQLHFVTGRATEKLTFDLQPILAQRLGYTDHPGLSAVERFMKHYFLVAKDVGDLTRILCSALEEVEAKQPQGVAGQISGFFRAFTNRTKKVEGSTDFGESNNRIFPLEEGLFRNNPVAMLEMFALAEQEELLFHPDAMQRITRSLKLITKDVRENPRANEAFMEVLTSRKTPERTLRKMNEAGLLGRFLPSFGRIVAMMQFNMYHHFTVDEHLLQSVGVMASIEHGERGDTLPLVTELFGHEGVPESQRRVLYTALLLHDIAKGRPEDHSIAGARIARRICPRLGLTAAQTEMVAWLVEMHLVMSTTAQSRDLHDPRTIADFANQMQTVERMRLLLVLTVCDITAVGPGVWNDWKGQLLRTLYYETEPLLTGGFTRLPRQQRVEKVKADVADRLGHMDAAEREQLLDLPYDNFWLSASREDLTRHLEFIRDSDKRETAFAATGHLSDHSATTGITLIAPDHPRLLSTIFGCCSAAGCNIVDAQIHTLRDGQAFNTILVKREFSGKVDEMRRADRVTSSIEAVLGGERRLSDLIAARPAPRPRARVFKVEPQVELDNGVSDDFTVIAIEARDRPGLLSDITNAMADCGLDIASAHIATFGEKVVDTFYVRDFAASKITSTAKLATVQKRVMESLKPAKQPAKAA